MSTHRTSYVLYTCTQCNPLHPLPPRLLLAPASPRSRARSRVSHADSRLARSLPKPGSSRAGDVNVPETRATPTTFPASRRCGHLTSVRCQMPDRGPRLLRPGVRACARVYAACIGFLDSACVCTCACMYDTRVCREARLWPSATPGWSRSRQLHIMNLCFVMGRLDCDGIKTDRSCCGSYSERSGGDGSAPRVLFTSSCGRE